MKKAMAKSRKETADQIADLLERMKTVNTVDDMDVLMRQAGEVGDRMHRIAENFKLLENKFPSLMSSLDFPTDYLANLNRMAGRMRRLAGEPTAILMNLLVGKIVLAGV